MIFEIGDAVTDVVLVCAFVCAFDARKVALSVCGMHKLCAPGRYFHSLPFISTSRTRMDILMRQHSHHLRGALGHSFVPFGQHVRNKPAFPPRQDNNPQTHTAFDRHGRKRGPRGRQDAVLAGLQSGLVVGPPSRASTRTRSRRWRRWCRSWGPTWTTGTSWGASP